MKNLKVLSGIFSALLISSIVYFSTSGFITEHNPSDKNKAPSVPCTFLVQVTSFEAECLTENYFYCIDGGPAVIATGDFFCRFTLWVSYYLRGIEQRMFGKNYYTR